MLNIVIFGAPGSGKGTQSKLIIEKYALYHISMGEILRTEIENRTPLGLIADEYISQGHFVPDQIIIDMFADILDKAPNTKGYIFDGFPRNIAQAKALDKMLTERETSVIAAFNLSVEDDALISRLLKRGELDGRTDDNLDTIHKRLAVYKEQTEPLHEFYKKQGKLFKIKGNDSIDEVLEEIMQIIDRLVY
ncbi:MAG: adenylate kinase [Candidatus Ordinivivax streblomastigis]|uniref:Adenylate kinase n=1 Tax=Candidatus Ordinivivax streblomastigis TaxID=2540710 RepID=A0A5M8P5H5_9BACT|nr:MAG: adenylate kinase [Candidatus Ordinivivax streblomastigis]